MEQDSNITGILNGDRKVVEAIWRERFPKVRQWVTGGGGTEDDAKDVFQDTFMVVYDKAAQPGLRLTCLFSTYFLGICRNLIGNLFQKKYFRHVTIPNEFKYIEDEPIDHDGLERRNLLDRAMSQLGKDCRDVMSLFFQEKTMVEIAQTLGFASEGYAKRRKFQCKERLLELIGKQPGFGELFNK